MQDPGSTEPPSIEEKDDLAPASIPFARKTTRIKHLCEISCGTIGSFGIGFKAALQLRCPVDHIEYDYDVFITSSQPDDNPLCLPVNVSHALDLGAKFSFVSLIYADCIDPEIALPA